MRTRENQPTKDMDFDLFRRVTMEMREAGVEEIGCFYLGESFMNPELLVKCVEWTKQRLKFPYVFLTSNASLADPGFVQEVMAAGLDSLKWSVNAADEQQYQEIMGVSPKYFHRALLNIQQAHTIRNRHKFPTKLYASSIKYNGHQHERMQHLLEARVLPYVDEHYWLPLYSMGSFATQREEELGYRPTAGNQGRIGGLVDPLPCWSAFTEGHVRADGGLSACCFDAGGQWVMGDLTKQSFMEAWNSEPFVKLREAHLAKDVKGTICEGCVAYA